MSLSPQDFKDSIGTASNDLGSVLVYRNRIIGLSPSGCDGWPLTEEASGYITYEGGRYGTGAQGAIYPPCDPGTCSMEERVLSSKDLYRQVGVIRDGQDMKDMLLAQVRPDEKCTWKEGDMYTDLRTFSTSCDTERTNSVERFEEHHPSECGRIYCLYCGRKIQYKDKES